MTIRGRKAPNTPFSGLMGGEPTDEEATHPPDNQQADAGGESSHQYRRQAPARTPPTDHQQADAGESERRAGAQAPAEGTLPRRGEVDRTRKCLKDKGPHPLNEVGEGRRKHAPKAGWERGGPRASPRPIDHRTTFGTSRRGFGHQEPNPPKQHKRKLRTRGRVPEPEGQKPTRGRQAWPDESLTRAIGGADREA